MSTNLILLVTTNLFYYFTRMLIYQFVISYLELMQERKLATSSEKTKFARILMLSNLIQDDRSLLNTM